jgi:hypothetical protein
MVIWKDLTQNYQIRFISNIFPIFFPFFFWPYVIYEDNIKCMEDKLLNLKGFSWIKMKYCMFKIDKFLQDHVSFPN